MCDGGQDYKQYSLSDILHGWRGGEGGRGVGQRGGKTTENQRCRVQFEFTNTEITVHLNLHHSLFVFSLAGVQTLEAGIIDST